MHKNIFKVYVSIVLLIRQL